MSDDPKPAPFEIDFSKGKVRADGAYDDVRPLVVNSVDGLSSSLRVISNIVGLPFDWVSFHLERFRAKYRQKVDAIPEQNREQPSVRITHAVLTQAAIAAEIPELQDLFANLLGTASDSRTKDDAHPGFANIISQLTPFDAKMIVELLPTTIRAFSQLHAKWPDNNEDIYISCANLCRLGVAEWGYEKPESRFASNAKDAFSYVERNVQRGDGFSTMPVYSDAARSFADLVLAQFEKTQKRLGICMTNYGRQFAKACLDPPTPNDAESADDIAK